MKISFHGAARGVTGSCHLVETGGLRILVDCGLFQGSRALEEDNADPFGFDSSAVDFVLLTHAHLDHCGRLPLLQARGFRGDIAATAATRELAELVLLDAARLQEEDAKYRARRASSHGTGHEQIEPLYSVADVDSTMRQFRIRTRYGHRIELGNGVHATFVDAGHILGSACVLLEVEEQKQSKRVLFSGDLGSSGRPILRDPAPAPRADAVVMETTYGDRPHKALGPSVAELYGVINETFADGGNVIIPTFALERAQELLFFLREGMDSGQLADDARVFLDSPMAISATEIFQRHPECYDEETAELFGSGHDPFDVPGLKMTRSAEESIAINNIESGAVILAGSGMCTGGRIRHHLRRGLGRTECRVVFVGYAARGTLARHIIDGAGAVRIFGDEIPVRAGVHTIGGFSAHADQAELLAWYRQTGKPRWTFLVHGEPEVTDRFGATLAPANIITPTLNERFEI